MNFMVYGIPKGQPRTKAVAFAGHARVYTPSTAAAWKSAIAEAAWKHREFPKVPWTCPLTLNIIILLPRPKTRCRKKDPDGPIPHTSRGDVDNYAKAVMDSLGDVGLFKDDGQIYALTISKYYTGKDDRAGAMIDITAEEGPLPLS